MAQPNPVQTFLLEADDLLTSIEEVVLDMNGGGGGGDDDVNKLFRAFHTLKGSGAMFDFDDVAEFTHHVESTLDLVRNHKLPVTPTLLDCVLAAKDLIKAMLASRQGGPSVEPATGTELIGRFAALSGASHTAEAAAAPLAAAPALAAEPSGPRTWSIRWKPEVAVLQRGTNVRALFDELRGLGNLRLCARTDAVPRLEELDPEACHLRFEAALETAAGPNPIRDVFLFVEDGSELAIEPVGAAAFAPVAPANTPTPTAALATAAAPAPAAVPALAATSAPARAAKSDKPAAKDATVRVTSEKLDALVNLVGELVMNQSRLQQVANRLDSADLTLSVEQIERLINELRDNVLGIRMMPIGSTFGRFRRLVHDLSADLGKQVDLVTEGAETEIDKTVLDQLADPLIHLIRNSLDHGIEPAEVRRQRGKPERGTIKLVAQHTGSNVVVRIEDDGKGLDREAILRKAREKNLIAADVELSDREVFGLIFLPGFSTAEKITAVSGRGVGMDVVKRQIEGLRGTVTLDSRPGNGALVTCTLPLTLAIVDGLAVAVADDQYVIPTGAVLENVELARNERGGFNGRNVVAVRGELIPYVRLRSVCAMPGDGPEVEKVVICRHADQRVGIVVDRVLGSHQTVIQPMSRFCRDISMLSGTTIMGDGRVALILDVAGLVKQASGAPAAATA